jgi:hypothetical protein
VKGEEYQRTHEPILDAELWKQAKRQREAAARSDGHHGPIARHLLACGQLRRPRCGSAIRAITTPTGTPGVPYERYSCSAQEWVKGSCGQPLLERVPIDGTVEGGAPLHRQNLAHDLWRTSRGRDSGATAGRGRCAPSAGPWPSPLTPADSLPLLLDGAKLLVDAHQHSPMAGPFVAAIDAVAVKRVAPSAGC